MNKYTLITEKNIANIYGKIKKLLKSKNDDGKLTFVNIDDKKEVKTILSQINKPLPINILDAGNFNKYSHKEDVKVFKANDCICIYYINRLYHIKTGYSIYISSKYIVIRRTPDSDYTSIKMSKYSVITYKKFAKLIFPLLPSDFDGDNLIIIDTVGKSSNI